jgi:hypothetical protein
MKNMVSESQDAYAVILGDQVASRIAERRDRDLIVLRQCLEETNDRLHDELIVPFSLSRGDEIQAVVATPLAAWNVVDTFNTDSWLLSFRFTIGVGALTTALAPRSWDMDGPCFHRARDAMDQAKRQKRWVTMRGLGERADANANGVIRALQVIRNGWTHRQRTAYSHRRQVELQTAAAAAMGLDQSTLSKMLKAAHYAEYIEIEAVLKDLLDSFGGQGDSR